MDTATVYTITCDACNAYVPTALWKVQDGRLVRARATHPISYTVTENGTGVRSFDTRDEAQEWVDAQS